MNIDLPLAAAFVITVTGTIVWFFIRMNAGLDARADARRRNPRHQSRLRDGVNHARRRKA